MAIRPRIYTTAEFKNNTNRTFLILRLQLKEIDSALDDYYTAVARGWEKDAADRLLKLITKCRNWSIEKDEQIKEPGSNAAFRKVSVDRLVEQAANLIPWHLYAAKKAAGRKLGNRALQAGYTPERAQYVHLKTSQNPNVQHPIGGGYAHEMLKEAQNPLPNVNFKHLTVANYKTLHDHFGDNGAGINRAYVHYVRKAERIKDYFVSIRGGLLYQKSEPLTTNVKIWIYAMDKYGNLLVANSLKNVGLNSQLNHSSLSAGKEVVCAGTLKAENGYLTELTNDSGHYQPSKENLHRCLLILKEEDELDISRAAIEFMTGPNSRVRIEPAQNFADNINAIGVNL